MHYSFNGENETTLYRVICYIEASFKAGLSVNNWAVNFPSQYISGWVLLSYDILIGHISTCPCSFFSAKTNYSIIKLQVIKLRIDPRVFSLMHHNY